VKFVSLHYEKLILIGTSFVLIVVGLINFFSSTEQNNKESFIKSPSFTIDSFGDQEVLIMLKETQLLPGNIIKLYNLEEDNDFISFEVKKVIFSKRSKVSITLNKGKLLKGRLLNPTSTILSEGWQKIRTPISFETNEGTKSLSYKEIEFIRGNQKIILDRPIGDINPNNYLISVYQSKAAFIVDSNRTTKSRWTNSIGDENSSIYDLFTPPIIYLVDGKLTTSLPEAPTEKEKEEDFGLKLTIFNKEEYRLKLASWIGKTPYFEDLEKKVSENSQNNVKNRLEVRIPYKENESYRPGLPSFVKTTLDDENKFLMVDFFTVQQIKDPKTGGVKPVGRALVKDFRNDGKSFEINSLMQKVYSGKFQIMVRFNINGLPVEDVKISESDIGKVFTFGKRNYQVLSIDIENKSLEVEKKISGGNESTKQTLRLEN
jgi:hypothetical protein